MNTDLIFEELEDSFRKIEEKSNENSKEKIKE